MSVRHPVSNGPPLLRGQLACLDRSGLHSHKGARSLDRPLYGFYRETAATRRMAGSHRASRQFVVAASSHSENASEVPRTDFDRMWLVGRRSRVLVMEGCLSFPCGRWLPRPFHGKGPRLALCSSALGCMCLRRSLGQGFQRPYLWDL